MTEAQYLAVCSACDRVLLAPDATMERVAIPWLHPIREHPVQLVKYAPLFEQPSPVRTAQARVARAARRVAAWTRSLARGGGATSPWHTTAPLPSRVDVLFVSHLLNAAQAGQATDFYFHDLPQRMQARGRSVLIVLINHTREPHAAVAKRWTGSAVQRVVLSNRLGLAAELDLSRSLRRESRVLARRARQARNQADALLAKVLTRAGEEAVSRETKSTLRHGRLLGALANEIRPRAVVTTHEGHAWERVTFAAVRQASSDVRCVGYLQAALFRLQHSVRRSLSPAYNPDRILTAGTLSRDQLERSPRLHGIPVSVLGSNRGTVPEPVRAGDRTAATALKGGCLVMPEGLATECDLLFSFSMECARLHPEMRFIWRLHPLITYEDLFSRSPGLRNPPSNVVLSTGSLAEDMAACEWTLYRGTTAVAMAVLTGLRPVYLRVPGELTIDPLFELTEWREVVETTDEFCRLLMDEDGQPGAATAAALRPAMELAKVYCSRMFTPFDIDALAESVS